LRLSVPQRQFNITSYYRAEAASRLCASPLLHRQGGVISVTYNYGTDDLNVSLWRVGACTLLIHLRLPYCVMILYSLPRISFNFRVTFNLAEQLL
jgi:hypothetical protein